MFTYVNNCPQQTNNVESPLVPPVWNEARELKYPLLPDGLREGTGPCDVLDYSHSVAGLMKGQPVDNSELLLPPVYNYAKPNASQPKVDDDCLRPIQWGTK